MFLLCLWEPPLPSACRNQSYLQGLSSAETGQSSVVRRPKSKARLTLALRLQPGLSAASPPLPPPWCSTRCGWGPATSAPAPPWWQPAGRGGEMLEEQPPSHPAGAAEPMGPARSCTCCWMLSGAGGRHGGTAQAEGGLWQPARSVWRPGFPLTARGLSETLGCPGLYQASGDGLHRCSPLHLEMP